MKIFRLIIFIVAIALIFWLLAPLYKGVVHIGMLYPLPILAAVAYFAIKPEKLTYLFSQHKAIMIAVTSLICVACIFVFSVIGVCLRYANVSPEKNQTVIILGCQVRGKTPSLMLYDRMNAAIEYLNENPKSAVICSGGQGSGEEISEAEAMKTYLLKKGIEKERIFVEDKSLNTNENIAFSKEVIKKNDLNPSVAVATDGFHQFRANRFCKNNGLDNTAVCCKTRWYFTASYYSREVLAVIKMALFK